MRLDFFWSNQSSTILYAGIKYSVHDLLCDVISNAWPTK